MNQSDDGYLRGIGGLAVKGALFEGRPVVVGQWGTLGFGYSAAGMREAASLIAAACDQADALVEAGECDA